jgi:hypothetical protein
MKSNNQTSLKETSKPLQFTKSSYPWMETRATVVSCRFEFARMHTFTLGIFAPSEQFLISFTYYAHGKTFIDTFNSPVAIAQDETFTVLYNPLDPQQNNKATAVDSQRTPIAAYGIAASIACSLIFLLFERGC